MSRFGPLVGSLLIVGLIIGAPLGYATYRKHNLRNLRVVKEGVLLRSGQLSPAGLERVIHDYGIRTVVSLRDSYDAPGVHLRPPTAATSRPRSPGSPSPARPMSTRRPWGCFG